jgi:hypothetical protein
VSALPTRMSDVQVGHWVLSHATGCPEFLPDQILIAFDQTPRSAGKDLLFLRWLQRGLKVPGGRLFDIHGVPERLQFGNPEQMAYGVVAHFVDSAAEGVQIEIELVTRYRIASAVIGEFVTTPICTACSTNGCRACEHIGTVPWSDNKRRKEIDTTSKRWEEGRLKLLYREALRDAATVERQATLAFVGQMRTLYPTRWANLLRQLATKR